MRASILANTIAMPGRRQLIGDAVVEGVGDRPENETWKVWIYEPQDRPDYIVTIEGPGDFKWAHTFFGPYEQTPDFIRTEVAKALTKSIPKATVIPLHHVSPEMSIGRPLPIWESITIENVHTLLKPENFKLWREYLAPRTREKLGSLQVALVHRFRSADQTGTGREEENSKDLLFKTFTCLRAIKPTKDDFAAIHLRLVQAGNADVYSFTEPPQTPPNVPDSESINTIAQADVAKLGQLTGSFLRLVEAGPNNFKRAVRFFNIGYLDIRDAVIQIITWVVAIESVFSNEEQTISRKELVERVNASIGSDTAIYEDSDMREFLQMPPVKVGDVIGDLLELRDRFVHGKWIPQAWKDKATRTTLTGSSASYADMLREAASCILRKLILREVEKGSVPTQFGERKE